MNNTITSLPDGDFKVEALSSTTFTLVPTYFAPTIAIVCHKTKKRFKFNPQENITAFELAWIMQIVVAISGTSGAYNVDTDQYISAHKLERHFEIT
jgi:hypothetical protein